MRYLKIMVLFVFDDWIYVHIELYRKFSPFGLNRVGYILKGEALGWCNKGKLLPRIPKIFASILVLIFSVKTKLNQI